MTTSVLVENRLCVQFILIGAPTIHGCTALWIHGTLDSWHFGFMTLWIHDSLESRHLGFMAVWMDGHSRKHSSPQHLQPSKVKTLYVSWTSLTVKAQKLKTSKDS